MFGWKKKVDKVAWAKAVYSKEIKNPQQVSEEQLSKLTTFMLEQHLRIIEESSKIVHATKNADTRDGRIALCHQHYQEILKLKPFCNREQLVMVQNAENAMKGI